MLKTAGQYKELQEQKEEDTRIFQETQAGIYEQHSTQVNEEQRIHNEHCESEMRLIQFSQDEIARMKLDTQETMNQINEDSKRETDDVTVIFEGNMIQVTEMGLKSKAELQLTKNKLTDVESEIEKLKCRS